MGKLTLFQKAKSFIKGWIASISWKLFLWGSETTDDCTKKGETVII